MELVSFWDECPETKQALSSNLVSCIKSITSQFIQFFPLSLHLLVVNREEHKLFSSLFELRNNTPKFNKKVNS